MSLQIRVKHQFASFDLDVDIQTEGGVTALFGVSGSGKSTLVNAIAGLLKPDEGLIQVNGQTLFDRESGVNLAVHQRRVGYIFQDSRLFPHMSVKNNLRYSRWFGGRKSSRQQFKHLMELLNIGHLLERMPAGLSGGERQRVAIGRACLSDPAFLLADEPLAALDIERKQEILPYFERLRDELGLPIVYVSHSIDEVMRLANSVAMLEQGRCVAQGPIDQVLADIRLANTQTKPAGALWMATVVRHHDDGVTEVMVGQQRLYLPSMQSLQADSIRLKINAEDVLLSASPVEETSALNCLTGVVSSVLPMAGGRALVVLNTAAGPLNAAITNRSVNRLKIETGQTIYALLKSVAIIST